MANAKKISSATLAAVLATSTLYAAAIPAIAEEPAPTPNASSTQTPASQASYTATFTTDAGEQRVKLTQDPTQKEWAGTISTVDPTQVKTLTIKDANGNTVGTLTEPADSTDQNGSVSRNFTQTLEIDGEQTTFRVNIDSIKIKEATWTATITTEDGSQRQVTLTKGKDGTYSGALNQPLTSMPTTASATDGQHTISLDVATTNTTPDADTDQLGIFHHANPITMSAKADTHNPAITVSAIHAYDDGKELTLSGGEKFTKTGQRTFVAESSNYTLNDQNQPNSSEVELSNGAKAQITWDKTAQEITKTVDGTPVRFWRLNGTASGEITQGDAVQKYTVSVTADRAVNTAVNGLTVLQLNAKGEETQIAVPGFNANTHEYTVTLPHDAVGDSYALSVSAGVDATISNPTIGLNGTTRVLRVEANGVTYTVNVAFQDADIQPDSPAKLEGIYVNYDGDTKGELIEGWNPNRLDYTISLKDASKSPYILPVAPDGVTVKAGNVTQSAQSTKQEWVVTDTATGQSRVYSVTVARQTQTAVTRFTAKDPVAQDATLTADSPTDTALASVGYVDANGSYHAQQGGRFTIPEGGTFSYEPKIGQSATVNMVRRGMTYTYTVNVLAPDGKTFAQHRYEVTYLTAATTSTKLDGIVVDGTPISGFNPDKTEYTVKVNDPDQWTVVAQYDKDTGMSVLIEKHGADATLTVTSGDGLSTRVYKVHAERKPFGGDGTVGVNPNGQLANTGVTAGGVAGIAASLVALGAAFGGVLSWRKRRSSKD